MGEASRTRLVVPYDSPMVAAFREEVSGSTLAGKLLTGNISNCRNYRYFWNAFRLRSAFISQRAMLSPGATRRLLQRVAVEVGTSTSPFTTTHFPAFDQLSRLRTFAAASLTTVANWRINPRRQCWPSNAPWRTWSRGTLD